MVYIMEIYTDGACRRNGRPDAYGGAAAYIPRLPRLNLMISLPPCNYQRVTNQRAELAAIDLALHAANARWEELYTQPWMILSIKTDSAYVCGIFEGGWLENWQENGWRNARGCDVANRDLIEALADAIDRFQNDRGHIEFIQIPREQNIEADRLANIAADEALD